MKSHVELGTLTHVHFSTLVESRFCIVAWLLRLAQSLPSSAARRPSDSACATRDWLQPFGQWDIFHEWQMPELQHMTSRMQSGSTPPQRSRMFCRHSHSHDSGSSTEGSTQVFGSLCVFIASPFSDVVWFMAGSDCECVCSAKPLLEGNSRPARKKPRTLFFLSLLMQSVHGLHLEETASLASSSSSAVRHSICFWFELRKSNPAS